MGAMFVFLKLVLAHMIGDFILQFEELYRLKVKSRLGHFFHALIHFFCSLLLVFPYLDIPFIWIFISVISVIHYFQDLLKYRIEGKHPKQIFWCFTIDQTVHFIFIASILLFPYNSAERGFPQFPVLNFFYSGNTATLYAIAYVTATFKGSYFLHALRRSFLKKTRPDHFITSLEVWHGLAERGFVVFMFLLNISAPALMIAWPLVALLRVSSKKLRNLTDFLLSFIYAAAVGGFFRIWL